MELTRLTKEQLKNIYENRMKDDFPVAELKPLEAMYDMMDRDCYDALAMCVNQEVVGYSLLTKIPGHSFFLLDYLSVYKEYRQCGYGSQTLSMLRQHYSEKTIFIESENPKYQDGGAKTVAQKRLGFYEKNGAVDTGVLTRIWTVPYINYILGTKPLLKKDAEDALDVIYKIMIPNEATRKKMVEIPQRF